MFDTYRIIILIVRKKKYNRINCNRPLIFVSNANFYQFIITNMVTTSNPEFCTDPLLEAISLILRNCQTHLELSRYTFGGIEKIQIEKRENRWYQDNINKNSIWIGVIHCDSGQSGRLETMIISGSQGSERFNYWNIYKLIYCIKCSNRDNWDNLLDYISCMV